MNKNHLLIVVALVGIQIALIVGLFAQRLYTLSSGVEVVLLTVPVDPRDIIRGDYVTLRYQISSLEGYHLNNAEREPKIGDSVYVELMPGPTFWNATGITFIKPGDYGTYIKGTIVDLPSSEGLGERPIFRGDVEIEYGIERYFVEAGTGRELERSGQLKVFVSVDRAGKSVIKRVEEIKQEDRPSASTGAQRRGLDAQIKGQLAGVRVSAELYYDQFGSYGTTTKPVSDCPVFRSDYEGVFSDKEVSRALEAVYNANGGLVPKCALDAENNSYAISSPLNDGSFWCVDSSGASKQTNEPLLKSTCHVDLPNSVPLNN